MNQIFVCFGALINQTLQLIEISKKFQNKDINLCDSISNKKKLIPLD